jgi:hypothetical protein
MENLQSAPVAVVPFLQMWGQGTPAVKLQKLVQTKNKQIRIVVNTVIKKVR